MEERQWCLTPIFLNCFLVSGLTINCSLLCDITAPSWIFYIYMYDCDDLITDFEQKYADLIRLKHEEQLTKPLLENASSKEQKEKN
jgi:hypothetical protein